MTDSQPDSAPDDSGEQPFSVGTALREARTRLGLSVADVAHRLKFAPRQVEALEADDFARLPEITFVRGFVRSYARLLQLDAAPLLAALPGAQAQPPALSANVLAEMPFPGASAPRKPKIIWLAAVLAVIAAAGLFAWLHGNQPKAPKAPKAPQVEQQVVPVQPPASAVPDLAISAPVATVPPPVAAPAAQPTAPPAAKTATSSSKRAAAIRMEFDEESWVEVTDREGRVLLSQVYPRGSEQSLNGKPPFSLVIGRSSAVRLYYRDKAVDLAPHTRSEVARLTLE